MYAKELIIRFEEDLGNEVCMYAFYGDTLFARLWVRNCAGFSPYAFRDVRWREEVTGAKADLTEVVDRFVCELDRCIAEGLV